MWRHGYRKHFALPLHTNGNTLLCHYILTETLFTTVKHGGHTFQHTSELSHMVWGLQHRSLFMDIRSVPSGDAPWPVGMLRGPWECSVARENAPWPVGMLRGLWKSSVAR